MMYVIIIYIYYIHICSRTQPYPSLGTNLWCHPASYSFYFYVAELWGHHPNIELIKGYIEDKSLKGRWG